MQDKLLPQLHKLDQNTLLTFKLDLSVFQYLLITMEVTINQLCKLVTTFHLNMCPLCLYSLPTFSIRGHHHQ